MRTMYILRTDDRPTDLEFWKISNGHISATAHPIRFMFGSRIYSVFDVGGSNGAISGWTKSKIAAVSRLVCNSSK